MDLLPFQCQHRVGYAECTLGNHIYYGRYLDILEEARGEFFRSLGTPLLQLQTEDVIFPVIECHVKYFAPARYDDVLTISVWPRAVERVRVSFGHEILKDGEKILEAETIHACTGLNEKPKRLPEGLRSALMERLGGD